MDGWWDFVDDGIDIFFEKVIRANLEKRIRGAWAYKKDVIIARIFNLQNRKRAFQIGKEHYDAGNELFTKMLDSRMTYSCGYWKGLERIPKNLAKAQEQKLELVCKKLGLKPDMYVLDIGCGWGSFMKYAAEKYNVRVVGYTVSKEQGVLGKELCKKLPIEFRLQDYRDAAKTKEKFDRIVSIGMFEHVGGKNYKEFMQVVDGCLKPGGLFLLHTIVIKDSAQKVKPWINKYIFPNAEIPTIKQIIKAAEATKSQLNLEDFQNIGEDYDPTCMAWRHNVVKNWTELKRITKSDGTQKYTDRFYRMWTYYLGMCTGSSRVDGQVWQMVFSKDLKHTYQGVR